MKILFCSSEVVPFAKTGGLADVAGALPLALEKEGCQVKVALPKYRSVKTSGPSAKMGKAIEVLLIDNPRYFDRAGLYGESQGDYPDNLERFGFFCQKLLYLLEEKKFRPDIIHCNDWQTALIPIYLNTLLKDNPFYARTKTVFTIHNLAYQGLFPAEKMEATGLGWELFNMHELEFYGKISLLKGALVFSRFITTVSPTYAKEIQDAEFGCGLEGVLRERGNDLFGIINGIDYSIWDPSTDSEIAEKFSPDNPEKKAANKEDLQRLVGLPAQKNVPLIGVITRLAQQKGIELIISALGKMVKSKMQFVLLGTGDEKYHALMHEIIKKKYPNIAIHLRFDATLAKKIYAGSDMFLMPSYYEPCGLGQLISLKYGTIPIVRKTGGLADTIVDYNAYNDSGNGFVFEHFTEEEMWSAIERALEVYSQKKKWQALMRRAMEADFSWGASARKYIELYKRAVHE
ncbi:MAG: glycogen synthase GlgA [Candidatus Omnitrophota bacterium]